MHTPHNHEMLLTPRRARMRKALLLALFMLAALSLHGCKTEPAGNVASRNANTQQPTPTPPAAIAFDGDRAFEHVRKQVEFGPRPAGSAELASTREYLIAQLKSYGLNVTTDEWNATTPVGQRKMVNVTAELPGESNDVIIISSHYDTKLFKEFRFVGANDSGSSTGVVMELARVLGERKIKTHYTYWFVLFDGEEAFCRDWDDCKNPDGPDNTYGSRRYVAQLTARNELQRVRAMVLLDMVGYKELMIPRELLSTAQLVDIVWQTARQLGYGRQFVDSSEEIDDDHIAFLKAGVKAVDIIQLSSYPYWHEAGDTLDKISPQSLKIVGDVMLNSLPGIEARLQR
jgi:glutaminyl-peptide cyclotransferase